MCLVGSWPPRTRYDSVRPDEVREKAMPGGAGRAFAEEGGIFGGPPGLPACLDSGWETLLCPAAPFSTFRLDREAGGAGHGS